MDPRQAGKERDDRPYSPEAAPKADQTVNFFMHLAVTERLPCARDGAGNQGK